MADSALMSSFVQAKNYTKLANNDHRKVDVVVIHDMEYPEKMDAAEQVANFFANQKPSTTAGSSAHYNVDADSVAGSVHERDVAWHAPGANHNGIGIEHAGYAAQRADQWADEFSAAELRLSARLTADICARYAIPIVWLSPADLVAGRSGITSHNNVTLAFKRGSHTDPGPNFPVGNYIELVRAAATGGLPNDTGDLTVGEAQKILDTLEADKQFWITRNAEQYNKILASLTGISDLVIADDGTVDVDKLATLLSQHLGDDVAKALGERLTNG